MTRPVSTDLRERVVAALPALRSIIACGVASQSRFGRELLSARLPGIPRDTAGPILHTVRGGAHGQGNGLRPQPDQHRLYDQLSIASRRVDILWMFKRSFCEIAVVLTPSASLGRGRMDNPGILTANVSTLG